jgi:23S rRNA-/tRNA-specific pseudouridylate synthase
MNKIPEIIFENANLIIIDKPSGYLSVPSRMGKADSRPVAGIIIQDYVGQQIFPVHRLDEETSGLLIFAKTSKAQSLLNRAFEMHEVQKTYEAITETKPEFKFLLGSTFKNKLFRGKKRSFEAEHGQIAETLIQNIETLDANLLLWILLPKTGRSHQLRVQLSMRGFPIVGDVLYGSKLALPTSINLSKLSSSESAIGLRAVHLDFDNFKGIETLDCPKKFSVSSWK